MSQFWNMWFYFVSVVEGVVILGESVVERLVIFGESVVEHVVILG